MDATAETAASCADCTTELVGRYCHVCGEDSRPPARRLRDIVEDALDNVFDFTAAVPRTLVALFTRPSLVPRALRAGDRKNFLSPFKLYLTATLVFFLFLGVTGVAMVQWDVVPKADGPMRVVIENGSVAGLENFRLTDRWLHPQGDHPRNAEALKAFDAAIPQVTDEVERAILKGTRAMAAFPSAMNDSFAEWMPRILWLMMPVYALLLWALNWRGTLVSDHVIFALWAHTLIFLLMIAGALWNMAADALFGLFDRRLESGRGLTLGLIAYQVYFTAALKGYYERTWLSATVRGLAHSVVYVGLIWFPLSIAMLMFWPALAHLPAEYWE